MQDQVKGVLEKLFPPGAELDDDTKLFLDNIESEFEHILALLERVINGSGPDSPTFLERWKKLTKSDDPLKHFQNKGYQVDGYLVSNSLDHLNEVASPGKVASTATNKVIFEGIRNKRLSLRAGKRIGRLAHFDRDNEKIKQIEKVKHSHVISEYKEQ